MEARSNPGGSSLLSQDPTNPIYIQQQVKIESIGTSLGAARGERRQLMARRTEFERNISIGPTVEKELLELNRGYESAREQFEEIKAKISEAKMSESLEVQNKGERFTLLERASLPTQPIEPNRIAIIFLGIVLAIGAGVGMAALIDGLDTSVRGRSDLEPMIAAVPMVSIPYVDTAQDRRLRWRRRLSASGAVAVSLMLVFIWI